MRYTQDFSTARMWPLMMKMALPSVIAQVVNMLYCIVDRVYIGHIREIGTDALAGVGICSAVVILISAFSAFAGNGGAPLAAIALGQQDDREARRILGNSTFLMIVLTVALLVPCYLFMEPILRATGASDATLPYAVRYLSVYLTGTFFVMVTMGLNPFINAQGRPGIAMATVIIGAVLNILLDPLFIFVLHMRYYARLPSSVRALSRFSLKTGFTRDGNVVFESGGGVAELIDANLFWTKPRGVVYKVDMPVWKLRVLRASSWDNLA